MNIEQKYCVVATEREKAYNRIMITGPLGENSAYERSTLFQRDRTMKATYKYFKVAKYPFKEIKPEKK